MTWPTMNPERSVALRNKARRETGAVPAHARDEVDAIARKRQLRNE